MPRARAQTEEVEVAERVVAAGFAGMSFGLGTLALSMHLATDDLGTGAAVCISLAAALGAGAAGFLVPSTEDGAMAVTFPTVFSGAAVLMVGWIAMSGTMSDDEVIAAVTVPLLVGPTIGVALAAVLGALDSSDDGELSTAAGFLPRVVVPISGTF